MTLVDKNAVGLDTRQYHIGIAPDEVSSVALLPGDSFRVPLIAEFLTDVTEVAHNREHRTMTGRYRGKLITATSTWMGCPSTAIAVEELARVGVTSFIRVGSTAGVQPGMDSDAHAFYAETPEWIAELQRLGIPNVEMESSAMYVVARLRGLRAGMICACSSNLVAGASLYDEKNTALKGGWRTSIQVALETAYRLDL